MKWPFFVAGSLVGLMLMGAVAARADSRVVPLGLTVAGGGQGLQLVQLKTSRDSDTLDLAFWNSIKESNNKEDYQAYLEVFPDGAYAPLARLRVRSPAESSPRVDDVVAVDLVYRVLRNANVRCAMIRRAARAGGNSFC